MNPLQEYLKKRDFKKTSEPSLHLKKALGKKFKFVVQEHHANRLHYDFRLEWQGVLKSWAVPKGPSSDPVQKRLAIHVEDHPLEYGKFQGEIPEGEYGAGEVFLWDQGTWIPEGDPETGLKKGHIDFTLKGKRMKGRWSLIRMRSDRSAKENWLLFKRLDEFANDDSRFAPIRTYGSRHERVKPSAVAVKKKPSVKFISKSIKVFKLKFVPPQLPLLVDKPPEDKGWVYEMKFDGYRIQALIENNSIRLLTRNEQDWTHKYLSIAEELSALKVKSASFDGEIVALDQMGRSHFQNLQLAMRSRTTQNLYFYLFDVLLLNGKDLRKKPLIERKALLKELLNPLQGTHIRYSDHVKVDAQEFFQMTCKHDLEGMVCKQEKSAYVSGRNSLWVKVKCKKRQEFVIGGYTDPTGKRNYFGALLLGIYEQGKLRYVGRCGTGFNEALLKEVWKQLRACDSSVSPFEIGSPHDRDIHWIKPKLVAEVSFSMWTKDRILRIPVFHGLREDKSPRQIGFEAPSTADDSQTQLTHPQKILFVKEKITKLMIANYYEVVAPFILPEISHRPLSLVRCPDGTQAKCFFQKHMAHLSSSSGIKNYVTVSNLQGVLELVQMGAFEIHCWNCREPNIENPDQIVMDLDPGEGVSFEAVREAAINLKNTLNRLRLKSFIKVSGGKGLHVHVPLAPVYTWDQIKSFSKALSDEMVSRESHKYTSTLSKDLRAGKIFIDYLRNGRGATAVAPYSVRAKATSAVAMPIEWSELGKLNSSGQFTLVKALEHLRKRKRDPWGDAHLLKQRISILEVSEKSNE